MVTISDESDMAENQKTFTEFITTQKARIDSIEIAIAQKIKEESISNPLVRLLPSHRKVIHT